MRNALFLCVLLPILFLSAACESLGGAIDQPSPAAVRAEASTFEAIVPALYTFVESDAGRPMAERSPAAGRLAPDGRSNAELGNLLGLLSDWSFRLEMNAAAAGVQVSTELPTHLEALKTSLETPPVVPTGGE